MLRSHVVEVDGVFVGAAIQHSDGYRFVAVAPQAAALDGAVSATLQDARRLAIEALCGPRQTGVPDQSNLPEQNPGEH